MVSVEKAEKLRKILLTEYSSFDEETIQSIKNSCQDITFDEFYELIDKVMYNSEMTSEEEKILENNTIPVFVSLFSLEEIVKKFTEYGEYSVIPQIVNYLKESGRPIAYQLNYDEIMDEIIKKNNYRECVNLYAETINDISFETKKKVFTFIKENISSVYIYGESTIADLLKTGLLLDEDISFLKESITSYPKTLVELCFNNELDVLKKYLLVASDEEKNIISALISISTAEEITNELVEELLYKSVTYEMSSSIVNLAVKKGYVPSLELYVQHQPFFSNSTEVLIEKNLVFYYFAKKHNYTSYGLEDKVSKFLDTEEKKQAFNLLKNVKSNFFYSRELTEYDALLGKVLDIKNIPLYFTEKGAKKELLYEIFSVCIKNDVEDEIPRIVFQQCKDELTEHERKYYDLFTTIMSIEVTSFYETSKLSELSNIISSPEDISKIDNEAVISLINSTKSDKRILLGLLKSGFITEEVKEIFPVKERIIISLLKEYLDNDLKLEDIYELYTNVARTNNFVDEDGNLKNDFFEYCISNNLTQYITSLSNKYVSDEQKKFIEIMKTTIQNDYGKSSEKIKFILDTFSNKEELSKYIVDGNVTKAFVDKLFELGAIENINKIENYEELLTDKQKLIVQIYNQIVETEIKNSYTEFITGSLTAIYDDKISEEIITKIPDLLTKINLSNSSEVAGRYISIAKLILQNTTENQVDPMIQFKKIEKIFLTRELSHMDKIFKSFQLLYPHEKLIEAILDRSDRVSPTLLKYAQAKDDTILGREAEKIYGDKTYAVEMIMYADLLKTTIASNDKTFIEYIENIEKGNVLFKKIVNEEIIFETLLPEEKYILNNYIAHLENMYNKMHPGKKVKFPKDLEGALSTLKILYQGANIDLIPDQIIKNKYQAYLGITTIEELKEIMKRSKVEADSKGRTYAGIPLVLEKGDMIKGIGAIGYLDTIIQNGSVSKEFLGGDAESDFTPFDTDLSIVSEDATMRGLDAASFGPIFFVVKNPKAKFNCTRTKYGEDFVLEETKSEFRKLELFRTGSDTHYGIRTGFPSTQVDYIYYNGDPTLLEQISLIVAKNGFYIPVIDKDMKLVFTPEDYDKLRKKMDGLSNYGINTYEFSQTLSNPYIELLVGEVVTNLEETRRMEKELEEKLREGFRDAGLEMKISIDGDMSPGSVELIDTGSTGRGTNQIGDGDFDFTVRLDRIYIKQSSDEVKTSVCKALGIEETTADVRKAKVQISDKEVEVDISYASKSDKITYTTDMCLADRLETIKKQDPEKYLMVLSNIILAKNILKTAECYKPHHARENPQGGLGGVGTENWILQNGGSLETAATEFLIAAGVLKSEVDEEGKEIVVIDENSQKDHKTFAKSYSVWDFGQNQLSELRTREFPYDNFVWNNMNPNGYDKMVQAMQTYILELHPEIKFVPNATKDSELIATADKTKKYLQEFAERKVSTENITK